MQNRDQSGLIVSGASAAAVEAYDGALEAYYCFAGDAVGLVERAIADSPQFVMAHVLKAWLLLVGSNPECQAIAAGAVQAARALPCNEREAAHVAALTAMATGEIRSAGRILEDVSIAHPRDGLALQAGQVCDFLVGDSRMKRDRILRAMPHWSEDQPDYHAILGLAAFGLEETGMYARAEAAGRRAIELQPRNGWAQHAVAHVLEMQDRRLEGVAWMRADIEAWTRESFFAVHNWWHLALFHLGLGDVEEVLNLFDGPIYGNASDFAFDMVDAAALLWRLELQGVDVGARWGRIADVYEAKAAFGQYAFDDAHAMMAFAGAGRRAGADALLAAQRRALEGTGDNVEFTRAVGLPVVQAIEAFGEGHYGRCVELLREVRNRSHRFGGSHAQRDLIDQTLIEAARRSGQSGLLEALQTERAAAKPDAPVRPVRLAAE
ncbi:MAG: tetratricopeptide repeat protein [Phenylobacterium sp.]